MIPERIGLMVMKRDEEKCFSVPLMLMIRKRCVLSTHFHIFVKEMPLTLTGNSYGKRRTNLSSVPKVMKSSSPDNCHKSEVSRCSLDYDIAPRLKAGLRTEQIIAEID